MRARRLLLPLALAAGLVPAVAGAHHEAEHRLLSANQFAGNGWVAQRLDVRKGDALTIEAWVTVKDSTRSATGWWLLREDNSLSGGMQFAGPSANDIERHVEFDPADIYMDEHWGGSWGRGGMTSTFEFARDGAFTIVAVGMSNGVLGTELNLYATGDTVAGAKTTGTKTFIHADRDFRGTANVAWSTGCLPPYPYWLVCGSASVQAGVSAQATIGNGLFGIFSWTTPAAAARWSNTAGQSGQLRGGGAFGWANGKPGTYTFTMDAHAGTYWYDGLHAWGADVALPA